MSKKNLYLAAILLVLAASAYLYRGPFRDWQDSADQAENFLSGLKFSEIDRIEIARGTSTTAIVMGANGWLVEGGKGFPASPAAMSALESALNDAFESTAVLASDNRDKRSEYGTDESGSRVKLMKGGDTLGDFIVGELSSEDYQSTYISRPDNDETILVKASLRFAFDRDEWRDDMVTAGSAESVDRIRFQRGKDEVVIEKKDGAWAAVKPRSVPLAAEKVDSLVRTLVGLRAKSIPAQNFTGTGLEKNQLIVQATGAGFDQVVMFGNKTGGGYYAKPGNKDLIYIVSESDRSALDKKIDDLK